MLEIKELLTITKKPKVNDDISLKLLGQFYNDYLVKYRFHYVLENGQDIKLEFKREDFCHLMGIHYFAPSKALKYLYRSHAGFERIENNEMTFISLNKGNETQFKQSRERMQCFPFLYQILRNCNGVYFDEEQVSGNCTMQLDIVLYQEFDNKMMHLGIGVEVVNGDEYHPISFFIAKGNKKQKYIKEQDTFKIISKKIEMISDEE